MGSIWTIRRSASDARLTGLCAGAARQWGVDPVLVRVGCALLALSGGIGIILYLAGWLLIPAEGRERSILDDLVGPQASRWPREAWVAVIAVTCIVCFALFGPLLPFSFAPAVILALIWYFGYYKNHVRGPAPPSGPPSPFAAAAEVWRQRMAETVSDPPPAEELDRMAFLALPDPVGLYAEPERPPRGATASPLTSAKSLSARRLRLVGMIVLGLVLSGLAVADRFGAAVSISGYLAAALLVIGLTLVAATWLGRARAVLPVGLLVLLALLSVTFARPLGPPQTWDRAVTYTTVAELPTSADDQNFGSLTVDLSQLRLTGDATYTAHVDTGSLRVVAPSGVNVRIHYVAQPGVLLVNGTTRASGAHVSGVVDPERRITGQPTLTLDLSVDRGEIRVTR